MLNPTSVLAVLMQVVAGVLVNASSACAGLGLVIELVVLGNGDVADEVLGSGYMD